MKKEYRELTLKEEKWIVQFQKLMKKAPNSLFMFVGEGTVIYPLDENGQRYMHENGAPDSSANGTSIQTPMQCDGGAY